MHRGPCITEGCEHTDINGRGLCNRCYHYHQRRGTLTQFPRTLHTYRKIEDLIEDYQFLRSVGNSNDQIAQRLGLDRGSLLARLRRHHVDVM